MGCIYRKSSVAQRGIKDLHGAVKQQNDHEIQIKHSTPEPDAAPIKTKRNS